MRKRNNTSLGASNSSDNESEAEESIIAAHPQDTFTFQSTNLSDEVSPALTLDCGNCYSVLEKLQQGKAWWVQCLTIYFAASLTYSYNNVGNSTNVQIAIMTVITVVGATPFASTHLISTAIGAFVGGQNIIASTGLIEDNNVIFASNYLWLLLLSSVVGFVWCFVINSRLKILDGYAGRLGTITFIGMNLVMVTTYGPAGVVDWNRYYYGFVHMIHIGEEDASFSLASAWEWTEEAELAVGYVFSVLWLGVVAGGTRILHNNYVQQSIKVGFSSNEQPPVPLNNVLVPVIWAFLSMLMINATQYKHAPGLYNGFAVGAYVAMASLQKIPSISKFASVSFLAAGWGLALTPFCVGFAGKSGFTSMLGHVTQTALEKLFRRFQMIRKQRKEELRRQLEQLQLEFQEQRQALQSSSKKDDGEREAPPSPHHHHHKPKKEQFYNKQHRRQQQRLKHLQEEEEKSQKEQLATQNPPKLHHRAWSALPMDGDDMWQHSLEPQQDLNSVV